MRVKWEEWARKSGEVGHSIYIGSDGQAEGRIATCYVLERRVCLCVKYYLPDGQFILSLGRFYQCGLLPKACGCHMNALV